MEDLQVEAARIITGPRHHSSRSKLYDELGWDILGIRYRYKETDSQIYSSI